MNLLLITKKWKVNLRLLYFSALIIIGFIVFNFIYENILFGEELDNRPLFIHKVIKKH